MLWKCVADIQWLCVRNTVRIRISRNLAFLVRQNISGLICQYRELKSSTCICARFIGICILSRAWPCVFPPSEEWCSVLGLLLLLSLQSLAQGFAFQTTAPSFGLCPFCTLLSRFHSDRSTSAIVYVYCSVPKVINNGATHIFSIYILSSSCAIHSHTDNYI